MALSTGPEQRPGFLRSCLVEGDSEEERRVRRNKRRAILVSIILQILVVSGLILFPLLSRGENIARGVIVVPLPPYARSGGDRTRAKPHEHPHPNRSFSRFTPPDVIPRGIVTRDPTPAEPEPEPQPGESETSRFGAPGGDPNGILNSDSTRGPKPPGETQASSKQPPLRRAISESVEQALLYHRVEPVYPFLALQTRREGRVELHAVISADGSIQSLEVLSGDPLLIPSALAAVREWRYHPTLLNGQPVEVDTHITVIYTLNH
jgi:TonB family protein